MLIDRFVPEADFSEFHSTHVGATPEAALEATRDLDLSRSFTVRALFRLRGLPAQALRINGLVGMGFVLLDEEPGREVVLGLLAQPWNLGSGPRPFKAHEFEDFHEPYFTKIAWNFRTEPEGTGARLSTETRVACTDAASRRRFGYYWRVIRPFSGWIRLRILAFARAQAEEGGV
ncbi:MAG: hypothetical protein GY725_16500 [bacterium]|nr:hypothetical protein [bacterium]